MTTQNILASKTTKNYSYTYLQKSLPSTHQSTQPMYNFIPVNLAHSHQSKTNLQRPNSMWFALNLDWHLLIRRLRQKGTLSNNVFYKSNQVKVCVYVESIMTKVATSIFMSIGNLKLD